MNKTIVYGIILFYNIANKGLRQRTFYLVSNGSNDSFLFTFTCLFLMNLIVDFHGASTPLNKKEKKTLLEQNPAIVVRIIKI